MPETIGRQIGGGPSARMTAGIAALDARPSERRHRNAALACGGTSAYAGPMRTPIHISARGLACRRGERLLFECLCFDLAPGGALVLRGANGSGKTSLLRLIAGLLPAAAGTVRWAEAADGPWHEEERDSRVAYLAHANGLKSSLTVLENLHFWQGLTGSDGNTADLLAAHGLSLLADLPAGWLSAGQQRRLALCRLSLGGRPLWLLDEPDTALDAEARAVLAARVAAHRAQGGSVMVASHHELDLESARTLTLGAGTA